VVVVLAEPTVGRFDLLSLCGHFNTRIYATTWNVVDVVLFKSSLPLQASESTCVLHSAMNESVAILSYENINYGLCFDTNKAISLIINFL